VQFNVSQLLREPVGSRRQYSLDDTFAPSEDPSLLVHVRGLVHALRTHRGILVQATLDSEATGECARCLQPRSFPLPLTLEDEYLPSVDPITGGRMPVHEEPGAFTIDEHHTLDLEDALRQAWVVSMPMRVLCREDCAGLCPVCGANRNLGPCGCEVRTIDPRWGRLAALRSRDLQDAQEEN